MQRNIRVKLTDAQVKIIGAMIDTARLAPDYRQLSMVDRYTRLLDHCYAIESDKLLLRDYGSANMNEIVRYFYQCRIEAHNTALRQPIDRAPFPSALSKP